MRPNKHGTLDCAADTARMTVCIQAWWLAVRNRWCQYPHCATAKPPSEGYKFKPSIGYLLDGYTLYYKNLHPFYITAGLGKWGNGGMGNLGCRVVLLNL